MAETTHTQPTLVVGGTGKTGRRLVERLTHRGIPVRIGSRSAGLPFDWDQPATWKPAFDDVRAAYLAYAPDLAVPGATDTIAGVVDTALAAGARRLVLLSGRGEEGAQDCEKILMDSGADWTVLRCSWFCQNFSEGYLVDPILAGEVMLPEIVDFLLYLFDTVLDGRNAQVADGVERALGRPAQDFAAYARAAAATGVWAPTDLLDPGSDR